MTENNLANACVNAGCAGTLLVMSYGSIYSGDVSFEMNEQISNKTISKTSTKTSFFGYASGLFLLGWAGYFTVKTIEALKK
jgi:hypothetical protein